MEEIAKKILNFLWTYNKGIGAGDIEKKGYPSRGKILSIGWKRARIDGR